MTEADTVKCVKAIGKVEVGCPIPVVEAGLNYTHKYEKVSQV